MNHLTSRIQATLALALVFAAMTAQAQTEQAKPTEVGRWVTQSGNLEVDIAPCGAALCGTIVRVMQNHAMSGPETVSPSAPAFPSPVGKKILIDLRPVPGGGYLGHIFNRNDNKTYNSLVELAGPAQLQLTIYTDIPANAQVQTWQRANIAE